MNRKSKKHMVLVSVAVITYNMERYLRNLLDSILMQEVDFKYEVVINDDCSPDHSRDIIESYRKKYPEIIRPCYKNKNVGGSRNMYGVMHKCRGKYIAILEGDDYWEDKKKLQYQVDFLEAHPEYIGMTGNSWCDHGELPEYNQLMRNRKDPKIFTFKNFQNRHFRDRLPTSTDTWMFRNFWHDGGDYSIFYKAHDMIWDQSLILILYGKGSIYADSKVMSHHRSVVKSDGTNYQSLIAQRNCLHGDSLMYERMEKYIRGHLHMPCGRFFEARGEVWVDAFIRSIKTRDREDIRIMLLIWREQKRKGMLIRMLSGKAINVVSRKLGIIE